MQNKFQIEIKKQELNKIFTKKRMRGIEMANHD